MKKHYILLITLLLSSISYSQIFITEIADPSNDTGCRYIELYNYGNSSVDLGTNNYKLQRYANAGSSPFHTTALSGTIPPKGFFVVGRTDFNTCYGFAPNQVADSDLFSNGDDHILLLDGTDATLDIFGVIGIDGTDTCHDFEDGRAERIASVTTANGGTWNEANWNVTGDSAVAGCTSHTNGTLAASSGAFDPGAWIGAPVTDTVVEFVSVDSSVSENTASIDICVSIANQSGSTATTVELNLDGASTTTNGSDYSSITFPTTLTFPAGSSANQCLTVTITNDALLEFDETLILNLQNPSGGNSAELGLVTQHTLTITVNDVETPTSGDIIITELLQNPNITSDDDGEFFEVYNKTASPIDMNGWLLEDHNSSITINNANGTTIVPANGYLVFATNADNTENGNINQVDYDLEGSDIILANSNGRIILTAGTTEIDRVEWVGDGSDNFPIPNGASMELSINTLEGTLNNDGNNWGLAVTAFGDGDLGTPGTINDFARSNSIADGNWSNTATWINGLIPTSLTDVVIENDVTLNQTYTIKSLTITATHSVGLNATNGLTINNNFTNNGSLTAQSGSSLIVKGTATGNIDYILAIANDDFHSVSPPVVGETYNDAWVTANSIASGQANNRGISTYQNGALDTDTDGAGPDTATGPWIYMQAGGSGTFTSGTGYSLKRTGAGNYTFTGTYNDADFLTTITQNTSNWNFVGNPFSSYIKAGDVITANSANLTDTHEFAYVWNGSTYTLLDNTTDYIHPGQGFFVNAVNSTSDNFTITETLQSHQTGVAFLKTNTPSVKLFAIEGKNTAQTEIRFSANATKSLDKGLDAGTFTGVSSNFNIYSHLAENSKGVDFARQVLPNSDYENTIIPIGLNTEMDKEITFSAEGLNLPNGIKIYLEDRVLKTFNELNASNKTYSVTLPENSNNIGRFYLHTKSNALSTVDNNLNNIGIYKLNATTLNIVGLPNGNANLKLYNILGKEVMNSSFISDGSKEINLPNLSTGIYLIQLETQTGKLNKKIIIE